MSTNKDEGPTVIATDTNPIKRQLLQAILQSAYTNQLGYLDGMDPDTGDIVPLLVGIDRAEDGTFRCYPIAKLFLKADELKAYLTPDDHGNFINQSDANGEPITADFDEAQE